MFGVLRQISEYFDFVKSLDVWGDRSRILILSKIVDICRTRQHGIGLMRAHGNRMSPGSRNIKEYKDYEKRAAGVRSQSNHPETFRWVDV